MAEVGKTTANALLAKMPKLGIITDKQIPALLGVAPFVRQSDAYKGTASIEGGRSAVRHIIYMAAMASIRYNSVLKTFYTIPSCRPKRWVRYCLASSLSLGKCAGGFVMKLREEKPS